MAEPKLHHAVTTIVSYKDAEGQLYIILARPDPRYHDSIGECLKEVLLPVGPCRFIGGSVENSHDSEITLSELLAASAIRELSEESGFNPADYPISEGVLSKIKTVNLEIDNAKSLNIHYFSFHMGMLPVSVINQLRENLAPQDDLIQIVHARTCDLMLDGHGSLSVLSNKCVVKTKSDFNGFPEFKDWADSYQAAIEAACDPALKKHYQQELEVFRSIHHNIKGLEGIDTCSLYDEGAIPLYDPKINGVPSDGEILLEFLLQYFPAQCRFIDQNGTTGAFQSAANHEQQDDRNNRLIVLATRNKHKIAELKEMMSTDLQIIGLDELEQLLNLKANTLGDVDEIGTTYRENATLKANQIVHAIHMSGSTQKFTVVADDSGLELSGVHWKSGKNLANGECDRLAAAAFPGVDTKQFVDACGGSEKALKFYDQVIDENRRLRAVTVLAIIDSDAIDTEPRIFEGMIHGAMVSPRGQHGFDYDPIFLPDGSSKTLGEMTRKEKCDVSHRRLAIQSMLGALNLKEMACQTRAPII